jgi:sterol desaturase/sphingolipid hydroxylase (fatty acid hydroxylase superfamily)
VKLGHLVFGHGSSLSLGSLASALCIAIVFLISRRRPGKKELKVRVMMRAVFPRRIFRSHSFRADVWFLLFNTLAFGILFGWAFLSANLVDGFVLSALTGMFGVAPEPVLGPVARAMIATIALFLAYEIGYWFDHNLKHRIPWLWEFHKVHHTAEILTPLTNYRVHPVDTVVFYNIEALFIGGAGGILEYVFGSATAPLAIDGSNIILLGFIFTTIHLQHSQFWIPATGPLGRILLSPAHHQLHHSTDPVHFNKNFGSCLALWDWAFGTLYLPARTRGHLQFGIEPRTRAQHTVVSALFVPFLGAANILVGAAGTAFRHRWYSARYDAAQAAKHFPTIPDQLGVDNSKVS